MCTFYTYKCIYINLLCYIQIKIILYTVNDLQVFFMRVFLFKIIANKKCKEAFHGFLIFIELTQK